MRNDEWIDNYEEIIVTHQRVNLPHYKYLSTELILLLLNQMFAAILR